MSRLNSDNKSDCVYEPSIGRVTGKDVATQEPKTSPVTSEDNDEVTGLRLILIHLSICLCTLIVGLNTTMVATATPVITSAFNSPNDVGWYGAAFYLAQCATQPLAGKIYTQFSKRATYLTYVAIFEIGSLICALSPNSAALIVGRAISGIGASGLLGGGLIIIITIIPMHKRAIWQGTWSSIFSIATIAGPLIGGALTEHVSWRWCFYINLPIGGASALFFLLMFRVRKTPSETPTLAQKLRMFDYLGFVLFAGSMTMLLLALRWGGTRNRWNSSTIIGLFVGAAVAACLFILWEIRQQETALIPPRLFRTRNASLICLAAFFVNGPFMTIVYWLPVWFQGVIGVSPVGSSVRYLPTVISDVISALTSTTIVTRTGRWNPFFLLGAILMSVAGGLLTTLYPHISDGHWIGYQIMVGAGYALVTNMAQLGMQASLPRDLSPIGATSVLTVITTSCAVFLAISQTLFQHRLQANLSDALPSGLSAQLITTGATNLRSAVEPTYLPSVIYAYSKSITQVWYLPAAAPVLSVAFICLCHWTSLKKKNDASAKPVEENQDSPPKLESA